VRDQVHLISWILGEKSGVPVILHIVVKCARYPGYLVSGQGHCLGHLQCVAGVHGTLDIR
jgi:hypothetical protein